ncbi:proline-rich protein PRCC [Athalia rosae]|uniref:proline-rich protein PRCC n=1 Tax=Athalia rosae TaxID=37344 RepID=UPI002034532D|nr:proline-rich protein PRCC [Athalia rosae]
MSLVAYGSSDESGEEDEGSGNVGNLIKKTRTLLTLPAPRNSADETAPRISQPTSDDSDADLIPVVEPKLFKNLPKPKHVDIDDSDEVEDINLQKDAKLSQDKSNRKNRGPVKISLPSLSEFKDVEEEEQQRKRNRIKPSEKGTGLFSLLPPPKGSATKATIKNLIPDSVKKVAQPSRFIVPKQTKVVPPKNQNTKSTSSLTAINYDSDSDDDSNSTGDTKSKTQGNVDFFSLANSGRISPSTDNSEKNFFALSEEPQPIPPKSTTLEIHQEKIQNTIKTSTDTGREEIGFATAFPTEHTNEVEPMEVSEKTLTSNVINLPKEEIRMKNKAEVGPKLPVPEQEYNVDSQGNVAFDEKAIEYLCGKRGVKRKNKDFDEANIIEINGEDIKPDEREWLVKALTEEPAERPVSMEGAGPSSQSRKKHQITYLAHQAKAMEVELKNQWAQNRVTRKQTQSKYGF